MLPEYECFHFFQWLKIWDTREKCNASWIVHFLYINTELFLRYSRKNEVPRQPSTQDSLCWAYTHTSCSGNGLWTTVHKSPEEYNTASGVLLRRLHTDSLWQYSLHKFMKNNNTFVCIWQALCFTVYSNCVVKGITSSFSFCDETMCVSNHVKKWLHGDDQPKCASSKTAR
jgi:hypothetical protein